MAILRLGAIITQISGKVGGQSFVNGAQGTYLKNIGNQTKQPTTAQNVVRSKTAYLMQSWKTLNNSQKQSWIDQVGNYQFKNRIGEIHNYNAFQIFMLLNQGRLTINQSINKIASNKILIEPSSFQMLDKSANVLRMELTTNGIGQSVAIWMTSSLGHGVTNVNNRFRKVYSTTQHTGVVSFDLAGKYEEVFGTLKPNSRIAVVVQDYITSSGQRNVLPAPTFFTTT